ncbi:hypothetical protein [Bacterioplanoides sp.]|uniref:hypothetical protein n=1 Tax=Bacterioplanoides sp. TaxID=2066072 RepID=UPI003AFFFF2D
MKSYFIKLIFLSFIGSFMVSIQAAEVTIPNQFSAGTAAVAAEVNANFNAVEVAVDDNAVRVAQLETMVASLESAINTLQAENAKLTNFVDMVLPYMRGGMDEQNNPAVFFSGANVHINNGEDSTPTINGTGNLIVGYNEVGTAELLNGRGFCSIIDVDAGAPYLNQITCENAAGSWSTATGAQKIGSHNIVIGEGHSYTQYSGIAAGQNNVIAAPASNISAGRLNLASGFQSSIIGGSLNTASGFGSIISGGTGNTSSGALSSVSGGIQNSSIGISSSVSGGSQNTASGNQSSASGGSQNRSTGTNSSISGGTQNTAEGFNSSVSGGSSNTASGSRSSVSGGSNRSTTGTNDWRAGSLFEGS